MIVISTGPSGRVCNEAAWNVLRTGAAPLDAIQVGLTAAEADPTCTDIGYGGRPDANGVMSLDAALMEGKTHRAGAVAGLLGCKNPVGVARRVLDTTPHVLLVGQGARDFATAQGFADEGALLTPQAADAYAAFLRGDQNAMPTGNENPLSHDTVGCCALGADGNLAVGCSTSGLAFKMPGRVGDSPIIGSGLYVENTAGAAACMGMGEQMMQVGLALRVVLALERGLSPIDACAESLRAMLRLRPSAADVPCLCVALSRTGETAGATTRAHPDFHYFVTDAAHGTQRIDAAVIQRTTI